MGLWLGLGCIGLSGAALACGDTPATPMGQSAFGPQAGPTVLPPAPTGPEPGAPSSAPQLPAMPSAPGPGPATGSPPSDVFADAGRPNDDASHEAPDAAASEAALAELEAYLAGPTATRAPLAEQAFAAVPLARMDADRAAELLWEDLASEIRATRASEHMAKRIEHDGVVLRYETVVLGDEPPAGRSLFISMHGGGSGPASQNDSQWRNQVQLATGYDPKDSLWVAPRAPTDDWNMWFKPHIDGLFDRLITNMIVFEGVDPNRVYLNGYSAGGDGVYGLSPRTADRWAGAGMSAGHPNGVALDNLRNVAFAIHVGGDDSAFDRNKVGQEYIDKLAALHADDPGGYDYQGMVHPGLPHWMNLADAVSIPFLQSHTRNPAPDRVVWLQHEVLHARLYWLAVDMSEAAQGDRLVARIEDQAVIVEEASGISQLTIRLSDALLDLDLPVAITHAGETLFEGMVPRTIGALAGCLAERKDPALAYPAELRVRVP